MPESNGPTGPRFVEFMNIPGGWRTPVGFAANVTAGQTVSGTGNYTPVFVNEPPNAPSNPSPANGTANLSRVNPAFSWTGGDPDSPVTYAFLLGTGPNPDFADPNLVHLVGFGVLSEKSLQLERVLSAGTTHYWKVKVRDEVTGVIVDSPVWQFTTEYSYSDIAAKGLSLEGNVRPGAQVMLSVTATNEGSFPLGGAYVHFYLSRSPGAKEMRLTLPVGIFIGSTQPGGQQVVQFQATLNGLQAGQSFIDAWIDPGAYGQGVENNFANNLQTGASWHCP